MADRIFEKWAPVYREIGLEPRPVKPGTDELAGSATPPEPFRTIQVAAEAFGLKYEALLGALNEGSVPSYQPYGPERLVLLSEVLACIEAHLFMWCDYE